MTCISTTHWSFSLMILLNRFALGLFFLLAGFNKVRDGRSAICGRAIQKYDALVAVPGTRDAIWPLSALYRDRSRLDAGPGIVYPHRIGRNRYAIDQLYDRAGRCRVFLSTPGCTIPCEHDSVDAGSAIHGVRTGGLQCRCQAGHRRAGEKKKTKKPRRNRLPSKPRRYSRKTSRGCDPA